MLDHLATHQLLAVALAFCLAGFVKGVLGLGLPTLAMGLLALVMAPAEAAALLVLPSLVTNIWQLLFGRASAAGPSAVADAGRHLRRHLGRGRPDRRSPDARRRP